MESKLGVLDIKMDLSYLESFGGYLRCACMFLERLWVNHDGHVTDLAVTGCSEGSSPGQRSAFSAQVTSGSLVEYVHPKCFWCGHLEPGPCLP